MQFALFQRHRMIPARRLATVHATTGGADVIEARADATPTRATKKNTMNATPLFQPIGIDK